jgi:hypothetical protein
MKAYYIQYKMSQYGEVHGIDTLAQNKADAYDKAVYELIPQKEGHCPYSAWVSSVTYNNGNYKWFNTFEGNPY